MTSQAPSLRLLTPLASLLLAVAAAAWVGVVVLARDMGSMPGTMGLGVGSFIAVWALMMAAMMLPSTIPTVALYGSLGRDRRRLSSLLFVAGYLVVWTVVGLFAFVVAAAGGRVANGVLAWDRAGRWAAGATLLVAAAYELTPLKDSCLDKCRSPLGLLLGSWRPGAVGGFRLGLSSGAWCTGCCWALMVSLFALGAMSIGWTAFVAGLVALEKLLPWRRTATGATTVLLATLGVLLLVAPGLVPGLSVPGGAPMPMGR